MDTLGNLLQAFKVFDVVHLVAGFFDQLGVRDDAVALIAVTDGNELAVFVCEVVSVSAEFLGNSGVLEVKSIVAPVLYTLLVTDNKECRRIGLVHLRGKGL